MTIRKNTAFPTPPHHAMELCIKHVPGGRSIEEETLEFCRALHLAKSTVDNWTRRYDGQNSGRRNPLDVLLIIMDKARELGHEFSDHPFLCLAQHLGYITISIDNLATNVTEISNEHAKSIKEFGEMMAVYGSSLANDGSIDCEEKAKILKESWEAIKQMATFLKAVEKLI
jgi:hypothetical protein